MHRISENLIFNTKSPQIFSPAVRCDRFGAILAVNFTINRAQSFPFITSQFSPKTLSNSLLISFSKFSSLSSLSSLSSNEKGRRNPKLSLSLSWVSLSPKLFLLLYLFVSLSTILWRKRKKKKNKKRRRRREKEKERKGKGKENDI
jgi:hypothetical protein